ncbi:MAG: HypC/HybG/HupF family hydrogenase formation chaperone [Candidatus Bipolaricaulis sp.]|nr:HypC/HybG/HupF family hydrogenase formation chaperone [Candidatus Bipolaricaulis sp.]MDD5265223.1 HypC/HybG/HupF family hydrogenase formation chaperone [Candidatus Bipolaricaulis sp.]
MCLAAPARVISVSGKTAVVDYQGVQTTARLDTLGEPVAIGDYVLVHTGFAIQRLTTEDAEETLRLFDELSQSLAAEGPAELGGAHLSHVARSATTQATPEQQGSDHSKQVTRSATIQGPPAGQGSAHPTQATRSATTQAAPKQQGGRGR